MSQVLSRAYNSNLPNSLSNFPLETRDCTSRIPDADISTIFLRLRCCYTAQQHASVTVAAERQLSRLSTFHGNTACPPPFRPPPCSAAQKMKSQKRLLCFNNNNLLLRSNLVPQSLHFPPKREEKIVLPYKENVRAGGCLCRGERQLVCAPLLIGVRVSVAALDVCMWLACPCIGI